MKILPTEINEYINARLEMLQICDLVYSNERDEIIGHLQTKLIWTHVLLNDIEQFEQFMEMVKGNLMVNIRDN